MSCAEKLGNKVESAIGGFFSKIGTFVGSKPRITIALGILLTIACGGGFANWSTENRADKLWVPQNTDAEKETEKYQKYFDSRTRFNTMNVQSKNDGENILTKEFLLTAMDMSYAIETMNSTEPESKETNTLTTLCQKVPRACQSKSAPRSDICNCLVISILGQWNYDRSSLESDEDVLATLSAVGRGDLEAQLGNPVFDDEGKLVSAEALSLSYILAERLEIVDNAETDPINEAWEGDVFLKVAESVPTDYSPLKVTYLSARSFSDEFGTAIRGDLGLVNISYVVVFIFLGATMGRIVCGTGSRWTMALGALVTVILSTGAGFGVSAMMGLFYGPVHSLIPFILLGIGVDDAFVIVNAFNRERKTKRAEEDNASLVSRAGRSLARAGASITVTSATDLVAFAISSTSALPALASFCGFASVSIFFLWLFASTFFAACMVLDERRQRDNRRECLCCLTRKGELKEDEGADGEVFQEDFLSRYFRNYHGPAILSKLGKAIVLLGFSGLLAYGIYGTLNLPVEDTERNFFPADSYLQDYFKSSDEFFPSSGIDVFFVFENGSDIYEARQELADFSTRLSGLSGEAPFIAEPDSDETYQNVMQGFATYLEESDGLASISETEFYSSMKEYTNPFNGTGRIFNGDVTFDDESRITSIRIKSEYVRLTKMKGDKVIDDAERQIDAMDKTRELVESWNKELPVTCFAYSQKFLAIEGFKVIKRELFTNVGLSILAVAIIVFATVASFVTSLIITITVAFCLLEILGFMYMLGISIDNVSVINIVLAIGLSVDYSAHVGHCFMTKGGNDRNKRALESLADIGAAVLNGATSTFLAVVVLLFSSSYVFSTLSKQFALTVCLGCLHGLVLLPVLLSLFGPDPFESAEEDNGKNAENTSKNADDSSKDAGSGSNEAEAFSKDNSDSSKEINDPNEQELDC